MRSRLDPLRNRGGLKGEGLKCATPPSPRVSQPDSNVVDDPSRYHRLQGNLHAASRITMCSVGGGLGVTLAFVGAIFLSGVSDLAFFLLMPLAPIPAVVSAFLGMRGISRHSSAFDELEEIIHREWVGGREILPAWFRIPRMYRRLRSVPPMSEATIRRLRLASLSLSRWFIISIMLLVLANAALGMVLAFSRVQGYVLAIQQLALVVPILAFYAWIGPATATLRDLQEYESVTGRSVLPPGLSSERRDIFEAKALR